MSNPTFISVYVTPRAGRDEVVGVRADASGADEICVRVTAAPDGGKANKAVCKTIAAALGVPKTAVSLASGTTSRHKRLVIEADEECVRRWVAGLSRL